MLRSLAPSITLSALAVLALFWTRSTHGQTNVLCNKNDWSPFTNDGGTWTFNNYSSNGVSNCSVVLTDSGETVTRMWFGNSDGTVYDADYSYDAFILTMEATIDDYGAARTYGEFALFWRTSEWNDTALQWNGGTSYATFIQTASGGRIWNRAIETSGSTDVYSSVETTVNMNTRYKVEVIVDVYNNNLYNITLNDELMFEDIDLSSYNLTYGSFGFWSYYSMVTVHSITIEELRIPTNAPTSVPSAIPSDNPSAVPSSMPSTDPTSVPSDHPSSVPSSVPTSVPSAVPSGVPSSVPTLIPSDDPTMMTTMTPSSVPSNSPTESTDAPTSSSGSNSGSNTGNDSSSSDGDTSIFENESIVIVLIICSFCACTGIICMLLVYFYFDRKHKQKRRLSKMEQFNSQSNVSENNNNNNNNGSQIHKTDSLMELQSVRSDTGNNEFTLTGTNNRGESGMLLDNNSNANGNGNGLGVIADGNGNGNGNGQQSDLYAAMSAALAMPQPQVNAEANKTRGMSMDNDNMGQFGDVFDDLMYNNGDGLQVAIGDGSGGNDGGEGFGVNNNVTGAPRMSQGGGAGGGPGAMMDTSAMVINLDEQASEIDSNHDGGNNKIGAGNGNSSNNLSQKDVLLLVKGHLVQNGFENDVILTFLKEFATKNVTGRDLVLFKKNPKLLDTFQMKFTRENQVLSIWLTINMIVNDIGKNKMKMK